MVVQVNIAHVFLRYASIVVVMIPRLESAPPNRVYYVYDTSSNLKQAEA